MQVTGDNAHVEFHEAYNDVAGNQYIYNSNILPEVVDLGAAERILRRLRPVNMDASHRTGCLPGTRTTWTQFIMNWALNPSEGRNVLWIYGLAGSGKSTLVTDVANQLRLQHHLGAFVFFERDVVDRSEPLVVIRTVAYQLGLNQTQLRDAICDAVENQPNTAHFPIESQFRQLLVDPISSSSIPPPVQQSSLKGRLRKLFLRKATKKPSATVIVLDAFDECGTPDKRQTLLRILSELTREVPYLRFIITSRPERDIAGAFEGQSHVLCRELDTSSQGAIRDVSAYLTIRINQIKSKSLDLRNETDWPGDEAFKLLVRKSSGLFIWATTVAQFIDAYNPKERLQLILRHSSQYGVESKLDVLYRTTLGSAGEWDNHEFIQDFRSIMSIVLASACPLSADAIDRLRKRSDNQRSCIHCISHLGCLLQQRPVVRLLHPSFADFLFTRSRCDQEYWFFDQTVLDHDLAIWCIDRLNIDLRTNICNLVLSPDPVDARLPEELEYASLYLVEHVCRLCNADLDIMQSLRDFLFKHLLHWLEAMSILKMTRDAIGLLQRLSAWLSNIAAVEADLLELVTDGVRFVRRYADLIEVHPLLIYASAVPFTPTNTLVYKTFHDPLLHTPLLGTIEKSWSPLLQVLSGHNDTICSVAISPDGTRIVSGSVDHTIRVWDVISGIEVLPELRGHSGWVQSVVFSPDGTRIASGSRDSTVRLWDASSGVEVIPSMRGHTNEVNSVAFSPDGQLIISGSEDRTIRVWDVNSGVVARRPLEGHTDRIWSVSCSQTRIMSGSSDETIRIWDINSGFELLRMLQCHTDSVSSVAFSPDGKYIASGSYDSTIRVWDSVTGVQFLPPFVGHSHRVLSVAFSPDGARIVSGLSDKTIRVWGVTTGAEVMPSLVYTQSINSVSFTPDGVCIISGSTDSTLQIWDAKSTFEPISLSEGHTDSIHSVAFSTDGDRLVTGSNDKTICVWDANSGVQLFPPLRGHSDWVQSVAFSSDGARIASGSYDKTVRLWDAITGIEILPILRGHSHFVSSVAFSPDGARIVSGSLDQTVRVWDAMTGFEALPPLQHNDVVTGVAFSGNGHHIVSRDRCHSYTWDAILGFLISKTEHAGPIPTFGDISFDLGSGWITNRLTNKCLLKLPSSVNVCNHAIHGRTLAIGTNSGKVLIMRFPNNP